MSAYAVVDIVRVQQRVIGILNAAPAATNFPSTVSGKQGSYPTTDEIIYAIIEADSALCRDVIITGHPFRAAFMMVTDPLTNNSLIPAHLGGQGMAECAEVNDDPTAWIPALLAKSKDEITTVRTMPTNYGLTSAASTGWAFIEDDRVYTTSAYVRVRYPSFVPNNETCQSDSSLEDGVVAGACALLYKSGSNSDFFSRFDGYFQNIRAELRAGAEAFSVLEQAEMQAA